MANFDTYQAKSTTVSAALNIMPLLRNIYQGGKQIQAAAALYQAGTDPAFNAAVDALHTGAQFTEARAMITQVIALIADWEASHRSAIGIE